MEKKAIIIKSVNNFKIDFYSFAVYFFNKYDCKGFKKM